VNTWRGENTHLNTIEDKIQADYWREMAIFVQRIMIKSAQIPVIRKHLLWEYEWESFDFSRLATVVIERVIERGNPFEWQEIVNFYGVEKISGIAERSTRLDQKHKNFTQVYLQSDFIHDLQRPESHSS